MSDRRPNVIVNLRRPHWDESQTEQRMMRSMDDVKSANSFNGYHFFERETLRYFSSRVHETLYAGRYFVTSERRGFDDYRRGYTVREICPDGSISTVGEFLGYASRSGAHSAAQRLADRAHSMARHPSNA